MILGEWFGRLIKFEVPVGYEDETGLHYVMQPARVPKEDINDSKKRL